MLPLVLVIATHCALGFGQEVLPPPSQMDPIHGGSRFVTTHAQVNPIDFAADVAWPDPAIKEWHFHVYWHLPGLEIPDENDSYVAAMRIRDELLDMVRRHELVAVLDGVSDDMLPGLNTSSIPPINHVPTGPHPCGSYEVWVPIEYVGKALSYFMLRRGELTILMHPLTEHAIEDHTGRAMWLGPSYRLNLNVLNGSDPPQYPELHLGYNGKSQ